MSSGTIIKIKPLNRSIYFYKGSSLNVGGEGVSANQAIELNGDHEVVLENGSEESRLLLLQGRPINEPVAQYGPFVMNTQEEIQEATSDYQRDQFGRWPWPSNDNVHPSSKGRFAMHADGKDEIK